MQWTSQSQFQSQSSRQLGFFFEISNANNSSRPLSFCWINCFFIAVVPAESPCLWGIIAHCTNIVLIWISHKTSVVGSVFSIENEEGWNYGQLLYQNKEIMNQMIPFPGVENNQPGTSYNIIGMYLLNSPCMRNSGTIFSCIINALCVARFHLENIHS